MSCVNEHSLKDGSNKVLHKIAELHKIRQTSHQERVTQEGALARQALSLQTSTAQLLTVLLAVTNNVDVVQSMSSGFQQFQFKLLAT